jgi:cell filamentation protein
MPFRPGHSSSDVPDNRFGLTVLADLQRRETPLALRRLLELQQEPIAGNFDTEHLLAIHRYIFQDVYDWAGELRTVNISKAQAIFPPPQFLKSSLDALFAELASESCLRLLPPSAWAHRAAYFLGEINAVHPFREGNGRTQREFIRELAQAAGHRLVWASLTQEEMIRASQLSFVRKDYSALERILAATLIASR